MNTAPQQIGSRPRGLLGQTRVVSVVALAAALALSACSSGTASTPGGGQPVAGGSVSVALPPNATPNWIFPVATPGHLASYNRTIYDQLFVRLYAYNGSKGSVAMDEKASAALPPKYSADGSSVTITLKDLTWSDGTKLSSRDVEFWYNLVKANKSKWGSYSAGRMPDNVVSFKTVDDRTFELTLDKSYNPDWFTANQLSLIAPLPHAAWDKQSGEGRVDDYDRTGDGAQKVFDYLVAQAKELAHYGDNPLWKVTDGPFTLKEFTTNGQVTLTRNPKYTGADAAKLDQVTFKPFTSADAEFNVLRSGGVDYGYIASSNLSQQGALQGKGYTVVPWKGWAITYIPFNFSNPEAAPMFKQLYIRQAMQMSVDQTSIIKNIWRDMAVPGYGPVPQDASSPFVSDTQKNQPYPFDLEKAKNLLTSHGWQLGSDGVASCQSAGTGANQCGEAIAQGTRLNVTLLAESGSKETDNMMAELKSSMAKIGIGIDLKQAPLNTVLGNSVKCTPTQAECSWQLSFFGTQGSWYFPAFPSGERIFSTSAASNLGSYSDPEADRLIAASTSSNDANGMKVYGDYLARNLPVMWLPNPVYQISVITNKLQGVAQDPLAGMQPQRWSLTK